MTVAPTTDKTPAFCLLKFPEIVDARGALCVADPARQTLPFEIKRVFWISGVPFGETRGEHAHHTCAEIVIPVCGAFTAHVNDGLHSATYRMSSPAEGLYIPPMVWCSFSDFSADCVCLCLTSHPYERAGYIDNLSDFLKEVMP